MAGWGYYSGDGSGDWGLAAPGRTDACCLRVRALKAHENGRMNVALLAGDSDGYQGERALPGTMGATYKVRFWLKGNAPVVGVDAVTWPNDPKSPADRVHLPLLQATPAPEWQRYEGTLTLARGGPALANPRTAPGTTPWQITWRLEKEYDFTAFSTGGAREVVTLGDGWGQRDHRNTDRGATLPYVLRTVEGAGQDQFVTVFAGGPRAKPPVLGVRRLTLPADAPAGAVALEVQTPSGTDVLLCLADAGAAPAGTQGGAGDARGSGGAARRSDLSDVSARSDSTGARAGAGQATGAPAGQGGGAGTAPTGAVPAPARAAGQGAGTAPAAAPVVVTTSLGQLVSDGRVAVVLGAGGKPAAAALFGGTRLSLGECQVACVQATCGGKVAGTGSARGESWFVLDGNLPAGDLAGQTLFVEKDGIRRAYPIRRVAVVEGRTRVYTKADQVGFEARPAETWEFVATGWK